MKKWMRQITKRMSACFQEFDSSGYYLSHPHEVHRIFFSFSNLYPLYTCGVPCIYHNGLGSPSPFHTLFQFSKYGLSRSTLKKLCWLPTAKTGNAQLELGTPSAPRTHTHTSLVGRGSLWLLKEAAKEKASHWSFTLLALGPSLPARLREVFYIILSPLPFLKK